MTRRLVVAAVFVLPLGLVLLVAPLMGGQQSYGCESAVSWSGGTVDGLDGEQMGHAATIVSVAQQTGLNADAAVIGVMTALTESSLRNVGYGDAAGPDSRGLFQQRTGWGLLSVRMDPAGASRLFFQALQAVPGWAELPPHLTAQAVQRSAYADGSNYRPNYETARVVVGKILNGRGGADTVTASLEPAGCRSLVGFTDGGRALKGSGPAVRRALDLVGSYGYYRLCARLAANIWGRPYSGFYSAAEQWQAMTAAGHAHPGDREPPVGALLFWDTDHVYGHVAVYVGGGRIVSNDIGDSYSGEGGVYVVEVDAIEQRWGATYLGWTPPIYFS